MDARNFLRAINNSAQSKVSFFENVVSSMGKSANKSFKLVALQPTSLIFEDASTHEYYVGDIKKDGHRYSIENIKLINIVEEKKADLFDKNCVDLVEAISENDYKSAEKTFAKIEAQRFRSRVIPESGLVTTRDGEVRKINVCSNTIEQNNIDKIVEAFVASMSDSVELSEGRVIKGTFVDTGETWVSPIDESTRRRIVAQKMRTYAEEAYKSEAFQKLIANVAGLICQQKIVEAVEVAAKFLHEQQEFCLLDRKGMHQLVESALAAQMEFNPHLINDVTILMYKTNLKVNHDSIIECWAKTAQKAQNSEWMAKVRALEESSDFGADYDSFLCHVLNEGNDIDTARAKAYLVALKTIRGVISRVEGQEKLVHDIDRMIAALESDAPDKAVVRQTEELLAAIDDVIIDRIQNLENFDRMPGVADEPEVPVDKPASDEVAVQLPDLGDEGESTESGEAMKAPEPVAGAGAAGAARESKRPSGNVVAESQFVPIDKMNEIELQEELLAWKTNGHIYLREDGFSDCFSQLSRLIDRANAIGNTKLSAEFERIRDVMVDSGDDVIIDLPVDPYAGKVELKEGAKITDYVPVTEDLGGLSGPAKDAKYRNDSSGMSELQGDGGVADRRVKMVKGTDASGVPVAPGAEDTSDLRMSKDHQDKTKGLCDKDVKEVSGADATGVPKATGAPKGDVDMAKDHQDKTTSIAEDNFVKRIAQALDKEEFKVGASYKKGAGYTKPHDLNMGELQGNEGVQSADVKEVSGTDAAGTPKAPGAPKGDVDMAKDHQDKTKGLAEDEYVDDDVVQEVPADDEPAANEDQRKGPRMHTWGLEKSAIDPLEAEKSTSKKSKGDKTVKEDVAVFYSTDERIDEVVSHVLDAMQRETDNVDVPANTELSIEVGPMQAPAPVVPMAHGGTKLDDMYSDASDQSDELGKADKKDQDKADKKDQDKADKKDQDKADKKGQDKDDEPLSDSAVAQAAGSIKEAVCKHCGCEHCDCEYCVDGCHGNCKHCHECEHGCK
ncbi:MAG: hypothetical protein QXP41_00220 [Candidatus Nitrosocaldus sp.]